MRARPAVSVVVPFRGSRLDALRTLTSLGRLELRRADELVVADNSDEGVVKGAGAVRVVPARAERSSYHARNSGARAARNDWLLFVDADCAPRPDLLDAHFCEPIADDCGAVSGSILGDPSQQAFLARYARSRSFLSAEDGLLGAEATPAGNLLLRRSAFEAVGGFEEGIRSGGDLDLGRRLRSSGWRVAHRAAAVVTHPHREDLPGFLAMIVRYGAGSRWLNERYPGSSPRWPLLGGLAGAGWDAARLGMQGRLEPSLFRALDGLGLIAHNLGYRAGNAARALPE